MLLRGSQFGVLLFLFLFASLAIAGLVPQPLRRQEVSVSPSATPTGRRNGASTVAADSPSTTRKEGGGSLVVTANSTSATISSAVSETTVSAGSGSVNGSFAIPSLPEDELPLEPRVTPGFGVAGILMLGLGGVYALIGIKIKWLHTFLSAAFLASLGTAVLIIYIMVVPVSDAIQGAYVVAGVMTGAILGTGAVFFKELTECLGCLLGGFCLSMWLLTFRPGGLLRDSGSRIIFICAFSVGGFALYFSRYTREYAMIGLISFAGATVSVLGVDCFSRAGLKEFWAYIWGLNDKLFPLGANTYPLTRGIRVEIAIIAIVCIIGVVSQLRLWKIIKQRRAQRDAARAEDDRKLQEEEEMRGREIEAANARERRQWEAMYGDGEQRPPQSPNSAVDSGVGDMENEKILTNTRSASGPQAVTVGVVEASELPADEAPPAVPQKPTSAANVVIKNAEAGTVTVRVAADEATGSPSGQSAEKAAVTIPNDTAQTQAPKVIPLPFRIPTEEEGHDGEVHADDQRSSMATFADNDDSKSGVPSKRNSLAKRLSQGSMDLLRSLSQRSRRLSGVIAPRLQDESQEELVIPYPGLRHDDSSSIAATVDGMSSDGGDNTQSLKDTRPLSIEINAQAGSPDEEPAKQPNDREPDSGRGGKSTAPGASKADVPVDSNLNSNVSSNTPEGTTETRDGTDTEATEIDGESATKKAKSVASVESTPVSLSKGRLPKALSRIAMSYRTNEWAKHVSNAEIPETAELELNGYPEEEAESPPADAVGTAERAAPVNVEELQQTPETGAPLPRSATSMSVSYPNHRQSLTLTPEEARNILIASSTHPYQESAVPNRTFSNATNRRLSGGQYPHDGPLSPNASGYFDQVNPSASTTSLNRPPVPGVVSHASPQTLIGQRDLFLRSRSQLSVAPDQRYSHYTPTPQQPLQRMPSGPAGETGSLHNNYPASSFVDMDDLPMSRRKELIRRNSVLSSASASASRLSMVTPLPPTEALAFDSHQPKRNGSHLPTSAARDAQLASFRSSVVAELRAAPSSAPPVGGAVRESSYGATLPPVMMNMLHNNSSVSQNLGANNMSRDSLLVRQTIDDRRGALMGQKEAEAQKRELERLERERVEMEFEERMRTKVMLEAHQDAMRRMQARAREGA